MTASGLYCCLPWINCVFYLSDLLLFSLIFVFIYYNGNARASLQRFFWNTTVASIATFLTTILTVLMLDFDAKCSAELIELRMNTSSQIEIPGSYF